VSARTIITAAAIVFIAGLAFLTVATMIEHGIDVLTLISLGVVALLAVGVLGALGSEHRRP
jgi:quinol-cytochrome oxidoreductase complex cytochrome b subunit